MYFILKMTLRNMIFFFFFYLNWPKTKVFTDLISESDGGRRKGFSLFV